MIALSIMLIVGGILVFRGSQGIGATRKAMDEEWGFTATTKEGYIFLAKIFGVLLVSAGFITCVVHLVEHEESRSSRYNATRVPPVFRRSARIRNSVLARPARLI